MSGVAGLPEPSGPPRCPVCGALNPPTSAGLPAQWCSQCHAPLLVEPEPPQHEVDPEPPPPSPQARVLTPGAPGAALDPDLVDRMLTELKASESDPWVERSEQVSGKGARLLLAVLAGFTVLVAVLALAWVIGALVA